MRLFVFGTGYCAQRFVQQFGTSFSLLSGTVRSAEKRASIVGIDAHLFSAQERGPELIELVREADVLLASIPPGTSGDLVIDAFADVLARKPRQKAIYLSSIGVYGDHGGAWVDEGSATLTNLQRTQARLAAERSWQRAMQGNVAILRLGGIYGPGRNAMTALRAGTARRIVKPGQVFNRIHVDDVAAAIMQAILHEAAGTWNVCDDEPAPPQDVVAYAARLVGTPPPAEEQFETAEMSAMARSFYAGNCRVSNTRLKRDLGVTLQYPNYRVGLDALWAAERCQSDNR
ncbi:MAG TPA: NAD-dependent epimerase/dehydratase family protein [Bradyrhizobium sp.]|nr:NAD-dependent epimerase/dehydratase family protein [Bradyrhizobium sp.]